MVNGSIIEPCHRCGEDTSFTKKEYNRKLRQGTRFFCSRSCAALESNEDRHGHKYALHPDIPQDMLRSLRTLIRASRRSTKRREAYGESNLTFDVIVRLFRKQNGRCAITNIPMLVKDNGNIQQVSLDRVDSDLGYTANNVQLVCLGINYLKHRSTNETVIKFLRLAKRYSSLPS